MRGSVLREYVNNTTTFLELMTGDNPDTIEKQINEYVTQNVSIPTIENVVRTDKALVSQKTNLVQFVSTINKENRIISPSGSTYLRPSVKRSLISEFEADLKTRRKKAKNAMFKAIEMLLKIAAANENFKQANAKISANAVSGVMKSAGNLFFDIGNYNAITSIARTVVALSASIIEQFCGGKFNFFTMDELINHIVLCKRNKPHADLIYECVEQFDLKVPTVEDVIKFLFQSIYPYCFDINKDQLYKDIYGIVKHLSKDELIYIYYFNNLKHLFMKNTEIFKPIIKHIMSGPVVGGGLHDPNNIHHFSEELLSVITICHADKLNFKSINDLIKDHPEVISELIDIGTHYETHIGKLKLLFDVFIYTNWIPPNLYNIKNSLKSSILLLDTDSNIFTTIQWVKWYTHGGEFNNNIENYQIHSLIVYFICGNVTNILAKFAKNVGVDDDDISKLAMKNEFLYPAMMIFNVKKNYTGLITVQEGRVLKNPKLDLKGVILRSSSICKPSSIWFKKFLMELFEEGSEQRLDGAQLIRKVVDFENRIRTSLENGETTFLKYTSIRLAENYADASSSAFAYADAWNMLFGDTADTIILPTKCPLVNVLSPPASYLQSLSEENEKLYLNFLEYEKKYKKYFTTLAMHPMAERIPKEIIPLIDIRKIVYHNVAPAYVIMKSIGLNIGYKAKTLLLYSDIYK